MLLIIVYDYTLTTVIVKNVLEMKTTHYPTHLIRVD